MSLDEQIKTLLQYATEEELNQLLILAENIVKQSQSKTKE